ncbi:hypothetical protein [Caenispirillum bisanense]|uniref:hypothetical protein n=1 Tax=Caenispirillum bisanense TaxID=414052 RepID=UPI0031DC7AD0
MTDAVIVKCDPVELSALGSVAVLVPGHKGAAPQLDDRVYVWTSETAGGIGLAMCGVVAGVVSQGPRHHLLLHIACGTPTKPLTVDDLHPFRDDLGDAPLARLARKLIYHAHNKVAALSPEEVTFLNGHFSEHAP